jgi:hypothetical protein
MIISNHIDMRRILFLSLLLALLPATAAADYVFQYDIYYYINGNEASVTRCNRSRAGHVSIPSTVSYNGVAYPVTAIHDRAFNGCKQLTGVTIPNSVKTIGNYAFYGCQSLTRMPIPNSVKTIGDYAFYGCSGLTGVSIGNSVSSIGNRVFTHCDGLTSIVVAGGNPTYDSRDNCNAIIETASNTLIAGCMSTVIPGSVTSIGDQAFLYCKGLTSVTIPNSVTTIGNHAFEFCQGLTSVMIPNSVTTIGDYAFYGCIGLMNVDVGNSVTSIGENVLRILPPCRISWWPVETRFKKPVITGVIAGPVY